MKHITNKIMEKKKVECYQIDHKALSIWIIIPCLLIIILLKLILKSSVYFPFLALGFIWIWLLIFLAFLRKKMYKPINLEYYLDNENIVMNLDNQEIRLEKLDEVSIIETKSPLTSITKTIMAKMQIDYDENNIVLFSPFLKENERMEDSEVYAFFKEILRYNRYLRKIEISKPKNKLEVYSIPVIEDKINKKSK